jgi:hypothetical protein
VPESEEAVEQDGRIARGERMKEAILRTTMAMVKEGNLDIRSSRRRHSFGLSPL